MAYPCATSRMIQSQPYTIPRTVLARLTAFYYLRTFWFLLIGPFLFGLVLMFLGPNEVSRFFGVVLVVWPLTVFARSLLLTYRNAKVWARPTVMTVAEDAFLFESQTEPVSRFKLRFESVRRIVPLMGYYLLQTRRFAYIPVPEEAISKEAFTPWDRRISST